MATTSQASRESTPELNPLSLGDLHYNHSDNEDDVGSRNDDAKEAKEAKNVGVDVIAPLPEYKAAGETVIDFDGLLKPAPDLRLREDLSEGCGGQTWPAGMTLAKHMLRYHKAAMTKARMYVSRVTLDLFWYRTLLTT